jgi:hypothetical protein
LAELKSAQKTKTKVTIAALITKNNNVKVERLASCRKVGVFAAAAADGWDSAAPRREKLNDNNLGQILQEVGS